MQWVLVGVGGSERKKWHAFFCPPALAPSMVLKERFWVLGVGWASQEAGQQH